MAKLTTSNLKIKKDGSKQYIYLEDDGKEHIIVAFSSSAADPAKKLQRFKQLMVFIIQKVKTSEKLLTIKNMNDPWKQHAALKKLGWTE